MKPYYVINWNFNSDTIEHFDIMPYFIREFNKLKTKPSTFEEFKNWFINEAKYNFWGRCEYEVIVTGWPKHRNEYKLDIYEQIEMNIDTIVNHFISQLSNK